MIKFDKTFVGMMLKFDGSELVNTDFALPGLPGSVSGLAFDPVTTDVLDVVK
jgi:hypothetical protein